MPAAMVKLARVSYIPLETLCLYQISVRFNGSMGRSKRKTHLADLFRFISILGALNLETRPPDPPHPDPSRPGPSDPMVLTLPLALALVSLG